MNRIILMGRLTRDPELRQTQSGTPVCSFTLAVDRRVGKDQELKADFIDCVSWNKAADFVKRYFVKGQMMAVEGRLQLRDWTDSDGHKRRNAEVDRSGVFHRQQVRAKRGGAGRRPRVRRYPGRGR